MSDAFRYISEMALFTMTDFRLTHPLLRLDRRLTVVAEPVSGSFFMAFCSHFRDSYSQVIHTSQQ